ncbi:MAG TPA: hypothetical protein VME66_05975 [Candidatus Acidoferrales bacterium]|nr:hypothetical protein [Candidatus Acidoferrales bacterium]
MVLANALCPAAASQALTAKLGAQFRFVVALFEKQIQRVFDDRAFADALKEGEPLEAIGEINVECVRDFCHTTFVAVGRGREWNAFRESARCWTPFGAGRFLGFHVPYDVRLAIAASYHVLFSVRKELIENP